MREEEFASYKLLHQLGRGLTGSSYVALREESYGVQKRVFLKLFFPELVSFLEDPKVLIERIQTFASTEIYGLVEVSRFSSEKGQFFIECPYHPGFSLSTLLSRPEHVPADVLLYILMEVLLILERLHSSQDPELAHGFLTPEDILVDHQGKVRLIGGYDSPLRSVLCHFFPEKWSKEFVYMAPEVLASGEFQKSADLYAVGMILYEGLCGLQISFGQGVEELRLFPQEGELPPLRNFLPDLEPMIEAIVLRASQKQKSERFSSAQEFYDNLLAFVRPTDNESLRRTCVQFMKHCKNPKQAHLPSHRSNLSVSIHQKTKPIVYVLAQDSVFSKSVKKMLVDPWQGGRLFDFRLLESKEQVEEAKELVESGRIFPHAVLFGALFIAMEHPFLRVLRFYPFIQKMILMEHMNVELLQIGINLCGLDLLLEVPLRLGCLERALLDHKEGSELKQRFFSLQKQLESVHSEEAALKKQVISLSAANLRASESLLEHENRSGTSFPKKLQGLLLSLSNFENKSLSSYVGFLNDIDVFTLSLIINNSSLSVSLLLVCGSERGEICFQKGEIVDATIGHLLGMDALDDLLTWVEGEFIVESLIKTVHATIFQDTKKVLKEFSLLDQSGVNRSRLYSF